MNHRISAFGLTKEQLAFLDAALPNGYELHCSKTVTDMIVIDALGYIVNEESLSPEDICLLERYYAEASDYAGERIIWIEQAHPRKEFVCYSSFLDLMLDLDSMLRKAQEHYDVQQMYFSEYAVLPARAIADSLEQDIYAALQCRYGEKPDPVIRKRMRQEWTALWEVNAVTELAAVYELCRWLKRNGHRYYMGGTVTSGFIPFLLGITNVNPLLAYLGGDDLVWQEYCSYGRVPSYVFHLPRNLQDQISSWQKNHWLSVLYPEDWKTAQPYESDHLVRGNMHFYFDAEKATAPKIPALCREDVFHYLKKHGFVDKDAFRGMNWVRKGKGFPVITEEMQTAEDNWILQCCAESKNLPCRADALEQLFFRQSAGNAPEILDNSDVALDAHECLCKNR